MNDCIFTKHFFCDREDGLKTGGKAKLQNEISLLIKKGEDMIAQSSLTIWWISMAGGAVESRPECKQRDEEGRKLSRKPCKTRSLMSIQYWVTQQKPKGGRGGAHKFCIESALQCGTSILSHDSGMNRIHMGALSKKKKPSKYTSFLQFYKIKPKSSEL